MVGTEDTPHRVRIRHRAATRLPVPTRPLLAHTLRRVPPEAVGVTTVAAVEEVMLAVAEAATRAVVEATEVAVTINRNASA